MHATRDTDTLRELADQVRMIADKPEMHERARRWHSHNALQPERPLVLCFPEGSWIELLPDSAITCDDPLHREWERALRAKIYWWEHIRDDNVLEPFFDMNWRYSEGNFGVNVPMKHADYRGSYTWDPPIKDFDKDFSLLKPRFPQVDRIRTERERAWAEESFGDLLPTRMYSWFFWTQGLTWKAIDFVGMEPFMLMMLDSPDQVHQLMAWLRDEQAHYLDYFEDNGYLTLNNRSHYTGSGGVAYTHELPRPTLTNGGPVRYEDTWGFAESQETVGISPAMFEEFVLPYQLPLLERFGLNCYGCCEPVHLRWESIKRVPRLRRVSVSPWCDQKFMAEALGRDFIFSRKPNPAMVASGFDEDQIRADLRHTLSVAGECVLEIILKDTHTVGGDPARITKWVQMALEECQNYAQDHSPAMV